MPRPLGGGIKRWCCQTSDVCLSDVCRVHHEYSQLLEARHVGRRGHKACMGWSWAAACGEQGRGISCGLARTQLVNSQVAKLFERPMCEGRASVAYACIVGLALNSRESCRLRQTILTLYNSWQWPSPRMNSFRRAVRCVNVVLAIVQCPYVCPSVTLVYCIETAKDHQTISGSDKPIVLAFWAHPALQNSKRKPLSAHKIFGIGKNRNFHFFFIFHFIYLLEENTYS